MATPPAGSGGQRRSRIVIDVGRMQAEAAARRGRGLRGRLPAGLKFLSVGALVGLGLLLLLLVGGYVWWQSYRKTPAYSLALLVEAARRDDLKAVEGLIDSDQIARGFVPQVTEKLAGGAAAAPGSPARRQIEAALPSLLPRVRETVRDEVARGVKAVAEKSGDLPFFLMALGVRRAAEVKEEGDAATVALKDGERAVELGMQRDAPRWKLVAIKDDALASEIAARIAGSLPPPPTDPARRRSGR